ncbi:hypothetical protein [Arcobacter sp. FWKO B]|uniref:hypothetical protein n=1 Tax=Arcobacter sp. FWKO B TaxID=2593672 RepID=UPI0018A53ECC|nr:hypothetical protein [Arcobacter sp. FWKO B]QOG12320.1 hypothetical protein FWKOB_06250 [Arcobacter sp. FWKO B]
MNLYLYAKSGHNQDLDRVRRASVVSKILKEFEPILCTCDFRAGMYAKNELGVKEAASVDVITNLPHMMERGDILIYDTDEVSDFTKEHMKEFCSYLYEFGVDIPKDIVDTMFFEQAYTKYEKVLFYGDDDYSKQLAQITTSKLDIPLLMGHYFFLGYEKELKDLFSELIDEESYIDTIKSTKFLLTGSINAALESLASGNHPVFFYRNDKTYSDTLELISKYNIPTIKQETMDDVYKEFLDIIKNYPQTNKINPIDISSIKETISKRFELIKSLEV